MMRALLVSLGVILAGAAGAGAWTLSAAPSPTLASLLSFAGWVQAPGARSPDYQIRLELPQTHRLAARGKLPAQPAQSSAPANSAQEAGIVAPNERERPAPAGETRASRSGLLDMKFDIATFGKLVSASDGTLRTSKPLSHGGKRVGSIDLALGHGSTVAVDRRALETLVGAEDAKVAAALAGMDGEMVSFDALRDRGIRIRYDALADAVVIEGGT